jgi:anaerobic ribonucleoside-triphosphate reductase|nr:hypothetical protein [Aeromicrobium sp.]
MNKTAAVLVTAVVSMTVLAGCSGEDPYCAAVKEQKSVLDSFGKKRTDASFATYAKAVRAITSTAPDTIKDDWAKLGSVTDGVVKAHQKAGIKLEDMTPENLQKVDSDDLKTLNAAYEKFNGTTTQRTAVVKDVKTACDITLK